MGKRRQNNTQILKSATLPPGLGLSRAHEAGDMVLEINSSGKGPAYEGRLAHSVGETGIPEHLPPSQR